MFPLARHGQLRWPQGRPRCQRRMRPGLRPVVEPLDTTTTTPSHPQSTAEEAAGGGEELSGREAVTGFYKGRPRITRSVALATQEAGPLPIRGPATENSRSGAATSTTLLAHLLGCLVACCAVCRRLPSAEPPVRLSFFSAHARPIPAFWDECISGCRLFPSFLSLPGHRTSYFLLRRVASVFPERALEAYAASRLNGNFA